MVGSGVELGLVDRPGQRSTAVDDALSASHDRAPTVRTAAEPPSEDTSPPTPDSSSDEDGSSRLSGAGGSQLVAPSSGATLASGSPSDLSTFSGALIAESPDQVLAAGAGGQDGYVVDLAYDAVWGYVSPGDVVTVTRGDGAYGAAEADGAGFVWTPLWRPEGQPADIVDGDTIEIYLNGAPEASVPVVEVAGGIDVLADEVAGTIADVASDTPVTVTIGVDGVQPPGDAPQVTTTTDSEGAFTALFPGTDLGPSNLAAVEYASGAVRVRSYVYPNDRTFAVQNLLVVQGYAEPGQEVSIAAYEAGGLTERWSGNATAGFPHGFYRYLAGGESNPVQAGDFVEVDLGGGEVLSTTLADLSITDVDTASDAITGTAPTGEVVTVRLWQDGGYLQATATADEGGDFTADLSGTDLRVRDWFRLALADGQGNESVLRSGAPFVDALVDPFTELDCVFSRVDAPHVPVTLTLETETEVYTRALESDAGNAVFGGYGCSVIWQEEGVFADLSPGSTLTLASPTWEGSFEIADLSWYVDSADDEVTGQAPSGDVEVTVRDWHAEQYPFGGAATQSAGRSGSEYTATFADFDVRDGGTLAVHHYDATSDFGTWYNPIAGQIEIQHFQARTGPMLEGVPPSAGETVTASLYASDGTPLAQTGEDLNDDPWRFQFDFGEEGIEPGRWVSVTSESGWEAGLQVPPLTLAVDPDTDLAWGQGPEALLFMEHYQDPSWEGHFLPGDEFALDWSAFGRDVRKGDWVAATYQAPGGNRVQRPVQFLSMRVNYGHDEVEGDLEPGHTLWLTVTESDGVTVKATAELESQELPWGGTGFATHLDDPWDPSQPDIQPGDWAYLVADDGRETTVEVGTISGELDLEADTISGTVHASWFTETLEGWCSVWEEGGPWQSFEVEPNGGSYLCDFSEDWDLRPGHHVGVSYREPDGDQVINVFREPAPEVGIWKWNTSGHARPGGVVVYGVEYSNNDDGTAENTTVVDTLPASTSWAGDTSGVTPDIGVGGVITWHLGDLEGHSSGSFLVTLDVDGSVVTGTDVIGENCATITTTTPGDSNPDNNGPVCTEPVDVWDDDVEVGVDKWPDLGDPTAGQEFEYHVNVCNNREAAAGPVWLTDTLPLSTTFVSWRSEFGETTYWTERITTGGQVVLYAPGLPGGTCEELRLRLLLDPDAVMGTTLENAVEVFASGDVEPSNDYRINTDARVSAPRYDIELSKSVHNAVSVPGGWVNYFVDYRNQGNSATHVWITETIPGGLAYDYARWGGGDQPDANEPLPDPTIEGDQLVWDLGVLPVSESRWFHIQMDISDTLSAGEVITNCATAGITATDETPWDNVDCAATTLYEPGHPNLYVTKRVENYQPGWDTVHYRVEFGNHGDEPVYNVHLTDTLPAGTSLEWHGIEWWGGPYTDTATADELQVVFERIEPGWRGSIDLGARLDDPNVRLRWYTNTVEIDTPADDANPADNVFQAVAFSGGEVDWVDLNVGGTRIWGCGYTDPVTVSTEHEERTYGECWDDRFDAPFEPGDVVTVAAGAGTHPVVINIPDPFTAYASAITDTVWGQIDALDHEYVNVRLDDGPRKDVQTDASGNYSAAFSDVPRGGQGWVDYETEIDYAEVDFHRRFQSPDLLVTVDYDHDYVQGNYEPGHTVWLTLTESDRTTTKATAELTTDSIPEWGGESGFQADGEKWVPQYPDIVSGDWVFGLVQSVVYTTSVRVGAIDAEVDVADDTISGTIHAPWLTPDVVRVRCEIHEENGPDGIEVAGVNPDGGSFVCDFSDRWDLQPGHNVAVRYTEPDGDSVQAHPENPAPYVRIQKWAEGMAGEGGNVAFRLQYTNEGGLLAENVVISDTLQGMTYITDTLGLPHSGSGSPGDPIVWELGQLDPQEHWIEFTVFAEVTEPAGSRITNTAQIATGDPYDQGEEGEKESQWSDEVVANDTHLNVGKWAWTSDPAPDTDFVYAVNVCNAGSTGSSEVVLTDTLHPSMTLQSWWGQHAGWTEEESSDDHLVVSRPSLPGWWCSEVYLTVHLDPNAWPGMSISNTAVISASNDLEGGSETTWWGEVGEAYTDLRIEKWWGGGQLVPGGEIRFHGEYANQGNLPASGVQITETLPANTSLVEWRQYDRDWNQTGTVSPTFVGPNQYVWDVGDVPNGHRGNYEIVLQIDPDAEPGTVLTNTIAISPQPDEHDYGNNVDTEVETVYGHGPNLRVRKDGWWDDEGEETRRASYDLSVENVGDVTVAPVVITDVYDGKMVLDGDVGVDYWRGWDKDEDPANHTFEVTLESLQGGEAARINFGTMTETQPLPDGLIFTNTAEVTLHPDDTNPADNADDAVLTTGPDLTVEKGLVDGEVLPGEWITFSLRFGNDRPGHEWWWNMEGTAWLTDTLPEGLEYITSTLRWCEDSEWCPIPPAVDGDRYTWELWPLSTGQWNEIYLTVRVADTATGLDTFTNRVEIASDQPISDTEPYYDNNSDSYEVAVALPHFEVGKGYESSRVAGTPITYTLAVTNVGNEAGTDVVLTDSVPAGLSDIATDGSYVGGEITWELGTLEGGDGTGDGWFSGVLPCSGTVTNDDYGAVSDEGVAATGAAVEVEVAAPALTAGFERSAAAAVVGTTFAFTDTSTTDGPAIVAWEWDFGDGAEASGETVSHAYSSHGTYTVELTVTDDCGYSDVRTRSVTVNAPDLVADFDYAPRPAYVLVGDTVTFTDTSTTDGPAIEAWEWDFGDGSAHSFTQNPSHAYTSVGTYTVGLVVTDTLGYSDQEIKADVVVVRSRCTELTDVAFAYAPSSPVVQSPVEYTATHSPLDATAPISYTWDFGDGTTASGAAASVEHVYTDSGTYDVQVTAYNPCTPEGVTYSERVIVAPRQIFLPLVVRNQ